ncbi:MAG: 16S rRNA (cytidine(1402)-2'-O)-methyltransferase [Elusimicrobia bacterium]|nr:16S rRNA (cytidine(1402)-2'-O)-methyltransferase [Candidatus Obscuribacterium magneticum]
MSGILYLVPTPIGNLSDITLRAIETLKTVQVVACEDTRRTEILLRHLQIKKPLMRYDEHTHAKASREILRLLETGQSVALVSDSGTPTISDPGRRLVEDALRAQRTVVPLPGPSAVLAALSAAGLPGEGFVFLGFLPRRAGRAERVLREALGLGRNVVVFESPFRVMGTLQWIAKIDPALRVVIARELTKVYEEFLRGRADELMERMAGREVKGEVVLVIGPPEERKVIE